MKIAATCAVLAVLVTGCGDGGEPEEAGPPEAVSYNSIDELREAVEDAGVECPTFERVKNPTYAAELMHCGETVVLSTFATETDKQRNLDVLETSRLVGPNWLVAADAEDLRLVSERIGGVIRERDPDAEQNRKDELDKRLDELEREMDAEG